MKTAFKILSIITVLSLFSCSDATVKIASGDQSEFVEFPDGSTAYLNKNSFVSYHKDFEKRVVKQQGEVFFVVKKRATPFIVTTAAGEIRVLGTEFNVKSNENSLEVEVEKGSVELRLNKLVKKIEKGQKALFKEVENTFEITKADFNHKKWVRKLNRELRKLERELKKGAKEIEKEMNKIGKKLNSELKKLEKN